MSGLDQPIVIANCCYHIGHERSTRIAHERGFFKEEGLDRYVIERGGLLPSQWEPVALGRVMWERGIDIATGVDARAAVIQRAQREDLCIVAGEVTATQANGKLIAGRGMDTPEKLRGARTPIREIGNLGQHSLAAALRSLGLNPKRDIEWITRRETAYDNEENPADLLRSGEFTLIELDGAEADRVIAEGYPVVMDLDESYKGRGEWPLGKVMVATRQTIEQRGDELAAFLRGHLRAHWFRLDPANHQWLFDLETRMRAETYNETERKVRMLRSEAPRVRGGPLAAGHMFMDGLATRSEVTRIIKELVEDDDLSAPVDPDEVLEDGPAIAALDNLISRGIIRHEALGAWRAVMA